MTGITFVNGQEVAPGSLALRADDRGFTLGDGLFETLRAYGGVPFRLREHLERLAAGAQRIALPIPSDLERQVRTALATFHARVGAGAVASSTGAEEPPLTTGEKAPDRPPDASIRITVSRGSGAAGLAPPREPRPTVVITVRSFSADPQLYVDGIRTIIASGRRNEFAATVGLKQLGYLEAVVGLAEARARGADDAIFLDTSGHLAEATTSNLFLVVDGELLTPPVGCGILPGVTRAAVLEVAPEAGLVAREEVLIPYVFPKADEAFVTASNREIVPVCAVDGRAIGTGRPGPVAQELLRRFRALVDAELRRT